MKLTEEITISVDRGSAGDFAVVLRTLGLEADVRRGGGKRPTTIVVGYPSQEDARRFATRGAGRRREPLRPPKDSEINCDTTIGEAIAYVGSHTVAESMSALGVGSRSTFYRRLELLRSSMREWETQEAAAAWLGIEVAEPTLGELRII